VFSVVRLREDPPGQNQRHQITALGSGFFVAPAVFLTCNHVINGRRLPHQQGDKYELLRNTGANTLERVPVPIANIGQELHLFPDYDAAILRVPGSRPFVSISYGGSSEGSEIGVAGYPLPKITLGLNQAAQFAIVYRVAQGEVNSNVRQILDPNPDPRTVDLSTLEVNFLFVSGNSGGPIFDAETGRALAYVHGYMSPEIAQKYETTWPDHVAAGAPPKYIQSIHATYSVGITLDNIRAQLEEFGVSL